jgi:hypothetical protein
VCREIDEGFQEENSTESSLSSRQIMQEGAITYDVTRSTQAREYQDHRYVVPTIRRMTQHIDISTIRATIAVLKWSSITADTR